MFRCMSINDCIPGALPLGTEVNYNFIKVPIKKMRYSAFCPLNTYMLCSCEYDTTKPELTAIGWWQYELIPSSTHPIHLKLINISITHSTRVAAIYHEISVTSKNILDAIKSKNTFLESVATQKHVYVLINPHVPSKCEIRNWSLLCFQMEKIFLMIHSGDGTCRCIGTIKI